MAVQMDPIAIHIPNSTPSLSNNATVEVSVVGSPQIFGFCSGACDWLQESERKIERCRLHSRENSPNLQCRSVTNVEEANVLNYASTKWTINTAVLPCVLEHSVHEPHTSSKNMDPQQCLPSRINSRKRVSSPSQVSSLSKKPRCRKMHGAKNGDAKVEEGTVAPEETVSRTSVNNRNGFCYERFSVSAPPSVLYSAAALNTPFPSSINTTSVPTGPTIGLVHEGLHANVNEHELLRQGSSRSCRHSPRADQSTDQNFVSVTTASSPKLLNGPGSQGESQTAGPQIQQHQGNMAPMYLKSMCCGGKRSGSNHATTREANNKPHMIYLMTGHSENDSSYNANNNINCNHGNISNNEDNNSNTNSKSKNDYSNDNKSDGNHNKSCPLNQSVTPEVSEHDDQWKGLLKSSLPESKQSVKAMMRAWDWAQIDNVRFICIFRNGERYVPSNIVQSKLSPLFSQLPEKLASRHLIVAYPMTLLESWIVNTANALHCDYEYGYKLFTTKQDIVKVAEVERFYWEAKLFQLQQMLYTYSFETCANFDHHLDLTAHISSLRSHLLAELDTCARHIEKLNKHKETSNRFREEVTPIVWGSPRCPTMLKKLISDRASTAYRGAAVQNPRGQPGPGTECRNMSLSARNSIFATNPTPAARHTQNDNYYPKRWYGTYYDRLPYMPQHTLGSVPHTPNISFRSPSHQELATHIWLKKLKAMNLQTSTLPESYYYGLPLSTHLQSYGYTNPAFAGYLT